MGPGRLFWLFILLCFALAEGGQIQEEMARMKEVFKNLHMYSTLEFNVDTEMSNTIGKMSYGVIINNSGDKPYIGELGIVCIVDNTLAASGTTHGAVLGVERYAAVVITNGKVTVGAHSANTIHFISDEPDHEIATQSSAVYHDCHLYDDTGLAEIDARNVDAIWLKVTPTGVSKAGISYGHDLFFPSTPNSPDYYN